jgi:hypothetical protein
VPASTNAIMTNVQRMADDTELLALWNAEATDERTPGQAWAAFVVAADQARIADRIPGTVGRNFKAKYAAEPTPAARPAKRTTRKSATKKVAK